MVETKTQRPDQGQSFMDTSRIVSFSDGVIAVIITILVLEIKIPIGDQLSDLKPLSPILLTYFLSFRQIGTFWNNHHHLMALAHKASSKLMWANLYFLFWISLIPFATAWLGAHYDKAWPVALYGAVALLCGIGYNRLQKTVLAAYPDATIQKTHFNHDIKGKISLSLYALGVVLAFINTWISLILYVSVAVIWFIPERRIGEVAKS